MSKVHTKTSPEIMQEVSLVKEQWNYNFQNQTGFVIPQLKSVNYDFEKIRVLEPKKWDSRPNDLKNEKLVDIKIWKPEPRRWRFRKTYLQNIA